MVKRRVSSLTMVKELQLLMLLTGLYINPNYSPRFGITYCCIHVGPKLEYSSTVKRINHKVPHDSHRLKYVENFYTFKFYLK